MEHHNQQQLHEHGKRHDQHFYDSFLLVFGVLALMAIIVFWIAMSVADRSPGSYDLGGAVQEKLIDQRLAPIGDVQIAGSAETQTVSTAPAPAAGAAPVVAQSGKQIWEGTCSACHGTGALGAPKIGDKSEWAPHLAKGFTVLEDHALHGFLLMPAKGGNPSLSDAQVVKALEYMISQSGGANLVPHH
ncbi:MAG: cytochrome c5 family protein [Gammaproteobacteria bacterium]|nr:c-type cytochrome [Gammaproteobacteria bacterium]MDE2109476.1 cytochrome c5 family protein [Gammaproteobacteria bacterium]MDE2460453.1 cytochrome c5 family protein [Gammaproteobacteria bacterium]